MTRRIIGITVGTPMNPQTIVDKSEQAKQLEENTKNIGELTELVDNIPPNPTKVSELENDKNYATQEDLNNIEIVTSWYDLEDRPTIPRKVSDLLNDKGYLTSIPSEYVTETELENKGYLTEHQSLDNYALKTDIPTDYAKEDHEHSEYLTEHQDLSDYAKKNELPIIPTNVSAFNNDKGYLTAVPSEYITESELESKKYLTAVPSEYVTDTELNAKGYLTAVPSEYALKTDIPTDYALKEHTHDQYLTEHQDLSAYAKTKDHYTKTESDGKYQEKGSYAPKEHEHTQYLTEHQDLSSYAKKTDISSHNANEEAHNDIRLLIENLVARVNALADSDDSTLDQMSEIVTYIKNNRNLIENVTTEKVNVNDIIDNLITSVSNKPLSAKQGVVLKGLIDAIVVPTKVSAFENDKGYLTQHQSLTDYAKKVELPTKVSQLTNDSGYLTSIPSEYINETELQTHTDQVLSAGEQLVLNGSQTLQNNYNFSQLKYDGSQANNSGGSLLSNAGKRHDIISDFFFTINPNRPLYASFDLKAELGSHAYAYVAFYDVDKQIISASHHMYQSNTLTRLTQDLKNGDTVVHLEDLTNWNEKLTANHQRSFIFWNYTNNKGHTYPPETYSRNMYSNLYVDSSSIDKTNKTITLSTAWNKATIPAGTYLSQGSSGNNYKYLMGGRITATTEWTTFKGGYDGVDYTGKNDMYKLPPGTAFAKFGMFLNYNGVANEKVWLTNIVVKEDVYSAVEEKADKTYVDTELSTKSDKNHTHSGYLTSIPSEYVTETELNSAEFITIVDIDNIVATYSNFSKYAITNNLTNVTTNNQTLYIEEYELYKAMLTPLSGYTINSVLITMGGVDITSDVYFDGSITIAEVTGHVVITATAV